MRKLSLFLLGMLGLLGTSAMAQEEPRKWPREFSQEGNRLLVYQPQVDQWKDRLTLESRVAVVVIPQDESYAASGALWITAKTDTDLENRTVIVHDLQITQTRFALKDQHQAEQAATLAKALFPNRHFSVPLDHLLAALAHSEETASSVALKNDPPTILVSETPARLLLFDGEPTFSPIEGTTLVYAVNTNWALFLDSGASRYYLLDETGWLTTGDLKDSWTYTSQLPAGFFKLPETEDWQDVKEKLPASAVPAHAAPRLFVSTTPAELIVLDGKPKLKPIPDTKLFFVANTDSLLFWHSPTSQYYYLIAGRWFRAPALRGPWTFASLELPADFARIPPDSPQGVVRASVPDTLEAREAVFQAQIPQVAVVSRKDVKVTVTYVGEPEFKSIEDTTLYYAINTSSTVIRVGQLYYLCENGVWFSSPAPTGPWAVVDQVPQVIYTIPPSSPVYSVTYVHVYDSNPDEVIAGFTAGYIGGFITAGLVFWGTGHYHPPYIGCCFYPYPVYYPRPYTYGCGAYYHPATGHYYRGGYAYGPYGGLGAGAVYNPATGAYARGAAAYGPHGGAAAWRGYNPTTGTIARGAAAYGPYGAGRGFQAYNPRTGAYAAGYQRATPYASWGQGVVSRGGEWAKGGYYSDARGTVGGFQTSTGAAGIAARGEEQQGGAIRTSGGDLYVGKDGNVYRRQGGEWQKNEDGNWNTVTPPPAPAKQSAETRQPRTSQSTSAKSQRSVAPPSESTGSQAAQTRQAGTERRGTPQTQSRVTPQSSTTGVGQWDRAGLERDFQARQRGLQNSQQSAQWNTRSVEGRTEWNTRSVEGASGSRTGRSSAGGSRRR